MTPLFTDVDFIVNESRCTVFRVYLYLRCTSVDFGMCLRLRVYHLMNIPHLLYPWEKKFPSFLRAGKVNTWTHAIWNRACGGKDQNPKRNTLTPQTKKKKKSRPRRFLSQSLAHPHVKLTHGAKKYLWLIWTGCTFWKQNSYFCTWEYRYLGLMHACNIATI